jgi:hypothetical protein
MAAKLTRLSHKIAIQLHLVAESTGRDLNWILCSACKKWIGGTPLQHPPYSPDLAPMRFLGFSNHEKEAPRKKISKLSTVRSTCSRSEWSVVRSVLLGKGGISKKRPSPHLHKVPTRINKVSPQTLQTAFVYKDSWLLLASFRNHGLILHARSPTKISQTDSHFLNFILNRNRPKDLINVTHNSLPNHKMEVQGNKLLKWLLQISQKRLRQGCSLSPHSF